MSAYDDTILADAALIAYWRLNGNANDSGPNGLTGTPTSITWGATGAITASGDTDTAATFGASSKITVPYAAAMAVSNYTVSFWLKPASMRNYNAGVTRTNGNLPSPFDFYIDGSGSGTFYHRQASGVTPGIATAGSVFTTAWQHIAMVADGSMIRLYRNGSQVAATAATATLDGGVNLLMGTRGDAVTQLIGDMAKVAYFSRGLSAAEVLAQYTAGTTAPSAKSTYYFGLIG